MLRTLLLVLYAVLLSVSNVSALADPPPAFGPVVLRARVLDRHGQPVPGVAVRLTGDLDGTGLAPDGDAQPVTDQASGVVVTDAQGVATLTVVGPSDNEAAAWFAGRADVQAELAHSDPLLAPLPETPATAHLVLPAAPSRIEPALLTLRVFEPPTRWIGSYPVWPAANGALDRIVVVLEGYDPYRLLGPGELMRRMGPVGDALRSVGVSLMVVSFPQSGLPPDAQAPAAARAIRDAAAQARRSVVVVGCSEGGLIARWVLVAAERAGAPLPVSTYVSLDVPNRGANLNPGLQEMVLRYGKASDRDAVSSPAAQAMMACRAKNVVWRRIGLPGVDRSIPVRWESDTTDCHAFFRRLQALGGYPRQCRLVGVANSPRHGTGGGPQLLHLWLPWTYCWTLPAGPEDRAPGSLLPDAYAARFALRFPLGVAGAYLRSAPTFIPASSALDAAPSETPPFDTWYARPDGSPPVAHDQLAPDVGAFLVRELMRDIGALSSPSPNTVSSLTRSPEFNVTRVRIHQMSVLEELSWP